MFRLLFVTFLAAASAGVVHESTCPELKPVQNFNLTAFQGTWYEISKFPTENEKNGKCAKAEYHLEGDVVKVKNSHVVNGVLASIEGTAKSAPDANNSAKLLVTLNFGAMSRESPLQVLATDYSNYAISYNCKYDEKAKTHNDNLWILSRTQKLEGDAKTAVDAFMKEHSKELDATKLVQTDFSEEACKYTSTSVVTEPAKMKQ